MPETRRLQRLSPHWRKPVSRSCRKHRTASDCEDVLSRKFPSVARLVGFDTPERGDKSRCDYERSKAEAATKRLRHLIGEGDARLERVACACQPDRRALAFAITGCMTRWGPAGQALAALPDSSLIPFDLLPVASVVSTFQRARFVLAEPRRREAARRSVGRNCKRARRRER
jgi:hypothetical protein